MTAGTAAVMMAKTVIQTISAAVMAVEIMIAVRIQVLQGSAWTSATGREGARMTAPSKSTLNRSIWDLMMMATMTVMKAAMVITAMKAAITKESMEASQAAEMTVQAVAAEGSAASTVAAAIGIGAA